jgi:citronellol/citronellal dehydrogenase
MADVLSSDALRGQSAIVTGAGSGIGQAVTLRLIELGADVVGLGRHEDRLRETLMLAGETGKFSYLIGDVRNPEQVDDAVRTVGERRGLDLLVNNAGGQFVSAASDISSRGWQAVIDLNLNGTFNCIRSAYRYLARSRGSVVNVSLSSVDRGATGVAHSVAARAGVVGLTKSLALEWAHDGIRVNCVGPGVVPTAASGSSYDPEVLARLVREAVPMGLPTNVGDVAELVAFLASPASALITGQVLYIDGGAHIGSGLNMLAD